MPINRFTASSTYKGSPKGLKARHVLAQPEGLRVHQFKIPQALQGRHIIPVTQHASTITAANSIALFTTHHPSSAFPSAFIGAIRGLFSSSERTDHALKNSAPANQCLRASFSPPATRHASLPILPLSVSRIK